MTAPNEQDEMRDALGKLNSPKQARIFLTRLNAKIVQLGDEEIPVDRLNDTQVVAFANKTMCFSMAAVATLTTL